MAPYDPLQFGILSAAFAMLPALFALVWIRRGRTLLPMDRMEAAAIAATCIGAWLLRAWLVEPTIYHENGHGYRYIGMAIDPASDLHVYGSGWQAFFHLIYLVAPPVVGVTLLANATLGALTCGFAGLLSARQFGRGAGCATAAVLAVLPIHVRMSSTESPFILAMFLTVAALWAVRELRERPTWDLALLAGIAAATAGQIRPLLVVVPPFVLAYAIVCESRRLVFLRTPSFLVLLVTIAVLTLGHARWLYDLHLADGPSHYGSLVHLSAQRVWHALRNTSPAFDPAATPPLVLLLAVLGSFACLRVAPAAIASLTLGWCGLVYVYAVRSEYTSEAIRFMTPATVFLALLAGPGLAWATRTAAAAMRATLRVPVATALVALTLGSCALSDAAFDPTADGFEYALLRDGIAHLPTNCRIVKPPDRAANGRVEARLPGYEIAYRRGAPSDGGPHIVGLDRYRAGNACEIYWRGLACALFAHDETASELRPECIAFESEHRLRPLFTRTLQVGALAPHRFVYATSPVELGFYRLDSPP